MIETAIIISLLIGYLIGRWDERFNDWRKTRRAATDWYQAGWHR